LILDEDGENQITLEEF